MPDLSGWLPLLAHILMKLIARKPRGLNEGSLRLKTRDLDLDVRWKSDDRPRKH